MRGPTSAPSISLPLPSSRFSSWFASWPWRLAVAGILSRRAAARRCYARFVNAGEHLPGPAHHLRQGYGGPPKPLAKEEAGHDVCHERRSARRWTLVAAALLTAAATALAQVPRF